MKYFLKKILKSIAFIVILLFSVLGISQEINFGVKAGLNISSLSGDYPTQIDKISPSIGFHIGGFANYYFTEKIAIQPEILFSRQGNTNEGSLNGISITQSPRLNYLNLALMGKYKLTENLHLEFGPQIGYTLSAKSKWEFVDTNDSSNNQTEVLDLLNGGSFNLLGTTVEGDGRVSKLDFGLNLGGSYDLNENMFVQVRYNLGLSIVDKNSTAIESTESWNLKNSVLQFSFGYKF